MGEPCPAIFRTKAGGTESDNRFDLMNQKGLDAAGHGKAAPDHRPAFTAVLGNFGDGTALLMQIRKCLQKAQRHPQYRQKRVWENVKGAFGALRVQTTHALDPDGISASEKIARVKAPFDQTLALTAARAGDL